MLEGIAWVERAGIAGFALLVLWAVWKFLDKWAGKFYDVQAKQAEAMVMLANKVTENANDQRESLIVMRSISASAERLHERDRQILDRLESIELKLSEGKFLGIEH